MIPNTDTERAAHNARVEATREVSQELQRLGVYLSWPTVLKLVDIARRAQAAPVDKSPNLQGQVVDETADLQGRALPLKGVEHSVDTPTDQGPAGPWKCGDELAPYHPDASHVSPDYRDGWNHCYHALLASARAVPQGWQMVPVEPTAEMICAVDKARAMSDGVNDEDAYILMLAAAPKEPTP